jgi:hypothetical protein
MKKLLFIAIAALSLTACTKEGKQGEPGKDGNANVLATNEFTSSDWVANGSTWSLSLSAADITQDVVNRGIVQAFIKYGNEWWALPDQNAKNQTSYGYSVGIVSFLNQNVDGTTPANPGAKTFRIVIITASQIAANPNVNWKDYKQVAKALNL